MNQEKETEYHIHERSSWDAGMKLKLELELGDTGAWDWEWDHSHHNRGVLHQNAFLQLDENQAHRHNKEGISEIQ